MRRIATLIISLFFCFLHVNSAQAIPPTPTFLDFIDLSGDYFYLDEELYLYYYTLSPGPDYGTPGSGLSHWWIELPPRKISSLVLFGVYVDDFYPVDDVETYFNEVHAPEGLLTTLGNPFKGHHYGVKWNYEDLITYWFLSTHSPVLDGYGNADMSAYSWFAKGGLYYDYGTSLGPNGPDGGAIPEPATMSLLGLGLLGLAGLKRKKS